VPRYGFSVTDPSAELRNRIYDFATEDDPCIWGAWVYLKTGFPRKQHTKDSPWKFFALSQACKQFRAEYRLLWIRNLSIRTHSNFYTCRFVEQFLNLTAESKYAPKLLQHSWEHGDMNDDPRFDITPLLRLFALSSSFRVEFIPRKVADGWTIHSDHCRNCSIRMFEEEHGGGYDSELDVCECPDFDMDHEEWVDFKYDQMDYTDSIREFVHNPNKAWRNAIRENKITVKGTSFAKYTNHITFKITYKEPICETTADSQPALDLLKQ
jgi:hypothetical protein